MNWECGNGMPELSLMQPICEILDINLNELFSGENLNAQKTFLKNRKSPQSLFIHLWKMNVGCPPIILI